MVALRAAFFTFLVTLLSFAVGLLLGIVGVLVYAYVEKIKPDMRLAYLDVAAPFAVVVGLVVLVLTVAMEIKHYRQSKTLGGIERAG